MAKTHIEESAEEQTRLETSRLASLIEAHVTRDGTAETAIQGLYFNRYSRTEPSDYMYTMQWPTVGIAAQGTKIIKIGKQTSEYSGSRILVAPVAVPISMQTIQASSSEPFLGVGVYLDPHKIAALIPKIYPNGLPKTGKRSASYVLEGEPALIGAVARLVACLDEPGDNGLLASLAADEIFVRLLRSPIGVYVAETVLAGSNVQRVAKAIDWLRSHFAESLRIAELADMVHLSESSFREYFKSVTSMSPLQYQKALRLQEAQRLMLSGGRDITTACQLVGYISDSQFSRDYSRFFGNPPSRDIAKWKSGLIS
ncbi:AraC family transcriptional regulator [Paenibacillus sp. FSL P2-0089]|uniref:AraC family transcriptional regulator n=1 Tax=Paenibacillus sp. FSL P2-0089 TaxID=2954526 RepID=UPI00315A94BA